MQAAYRTYCGSPLCIPEQGQLFKTEIPKGMCEHYGIEYVGQNGWNIFFRIARPTTKVGVSTIIFALESIFNDRRTKRNKGIVLLRTNKEDVDEKN